jgi:acyl-CoA thioester hydrolase
MEINFKDYQHHIEMNIRFMDLDAMNHVNNARYLNFLEEARIAYSQEMLDLFKNINDLNVVVARIEIDYIRPILYGEKVKVLSRIKSMGKKSFTFDSLICVKKGEELIVAAKAIQVIVAFNPSTNKSTEIPLEMANRIKQIEKL